MASGAAGSHPASRRRLMARRVRALTLTLGVSALLLGRTMAANSELDVDTTLTGTPDLSAAATYTQNTTPTTASDVTFTNAAYGTATFSSGTGTLTLGTLNDLDATGQALTISGSAPITLSGGSNSVAAANGGSAADLLYIANTASLSVTASPVSIGSSISAGNLDIAGIYSQASALRGGSANLVLTKTGAGNLTLSNNGNDITASNLAITGGTLTLTGAGSQGGILQNVSAITVGGTGATLLLNGSSNDTLGYTVGKEALTINSGGSVLNNAAGIRVTLANPVTMTGGTLGGSSTGDSNGGAFSFDVTSGNAVNATSDAGGVPAVVSAVTTLQAASTFNVTRGTGTADLTFTKAINQFNGGGNGITKTGNGIMVSTAFNGYTGATTISGGTLQLGNGTNSGTIAGSSIVDNATLAFDNASNQTYTGVISGTGAVTVANPGTFQEVLTNANTYTGTTTISSGVLQLGGNGATGSLSPSSTIVDNGTFILYRSNPVVQGTDFSGSPISGTGGLTQGGSGTTTLNAANTYSGTTLIQGTGALILANQNAIQNSTLSGGPVQFDQSVTANAFTIGGLAGSTALTLANNATTPAGIALTLGNNNANASYGGVLSGAGSLIKTGTGTQTLTSNSTYTGTTTINGGTLTLTAGGSAGGALAGTPSITVNSGGTLSLTNSDTLGYTAGKEALFINGTGVVTNAANVRDTLQNTVTMVGGTLTGVANTTTNGAYSFDISGGGGLNATSDATGNAATISGPAVSLQVSGTVFNVTRGVAAPAVDANISSAIINYNTTGTPGLTKTGNGILQFSGANTFNGGLTESAGTILLTGSLASQALTLGSSTSGSSISGATFNYAPTTGGSTQALGNLSLAGGANTVSAAAGNTLALGTIGRSATTSKTTVDFNPASTGTITTTSANDGTGILSSGGIANISYGSGTSLSYATASGGSSPYTVAAYTAGSTFTSSTSSTTTNYNFAGGTSSSASPANANTLRYTGGAGALTIPAGSKVTTAGLMNAGTGTFTINGPIVTGTTSNQGLGAGNGSIAELVVFGNTQPIVFNTSIVDNYNSTTSSYNSSAVTFSTAGTVTLNALNTYRGATSVLSGTVVANTANALATTSGISVSAGAMLTFAANSALAAPAAPTTTSITPGTAGTATGQVPITLNGGTLLRTGTGVSLGSGTLVGVGALTLNATSTLDFGTTGVGTLNVNGLSDANNSLLTVVDFTHSSSGAGTDGTDDRLIFNEPLTTALLADISFNGIAATQLSLGNGEFEILPITAVPEPSTWIGGLLSISMVACCRWRQLRDRLIA